MENQKPELKLVSPKTLEQAIAQMNLHIQSAVPPGLDRQGLLEDLRELATISARDVAKAEVVVEKNLKEVKEIVVAILTNAFNLRNEMPDISKCFGSAGSALAHFLGFPDEEITDAVQELVFEVRLRSAFDTILRETSPKGGLQ
jgi:hypothetical protein